MTSGNVTEWSHAAKFNKYCPIFIARHRHACLKQNIRSGLAEQISLVWWLVPAMESLIESRLIVWREKNDDGLRIRERRVQDLPYIRTWSVC